MAKLSGVEVGYGVVARNGVKGEVIDIISEMVYPVFCEMENGVVVNVDMEGKYWGEEVEGMYDVRLEEEEDDVVWNGMEEVVFWEIE